MSEHNYYDEQVKYLLPIDEFGVQIKMTSTKGETKWMPLNDKSFKTVTDALIILRGADIESKEIKEPDTTQFQQGRESVFKEIREYALKVKDIPSRTEEICSELRSELKQLREDLLREMAKSKKFRDLSCKYRKELQNLKNKIKDSMA